MRGILGWIIAVAVLGLTILVGIPVSAEVPGEKYALLVGVRYYEPSEPLPHLTYTEDDIEELASTLVAAGYKRDNIKLMTHHEGGNRPRFSPEAAKIRKEFGLTLDRLEAGDSVVVALAGHGVQFEQNGPSFFCPADATLDDEKTLIHLGELSQSLRDCKAGFKLLLVDACRNNPKLVVARTAGRPVVDSPSHSRPFVNLAPGGVAALFSCSAGQIAYENPELKHGVFFHFVIQGLQGHADLDGDGMVNVEELGLFAKNQVARFVDVTYGKPQTPELLNHTRGAVALVRVTISRPVLVPVPEPALTPTPRRPARDAKEITSAIGMKLVLIPSGEFLMGSPDLDREAQVDEKPQHRVRITRPFYMGVHEVTQGQYREVTGANPSQFPGSDDLPVERVSWNGVPAAMRIPQVRAVVGQVAGVSFIGALSFCNSLSERDGLKPYYRITQNTAVPQPGNDGYRLPTEAEWEYACRAGSASKYSFGPDAALLGEFAWFNGNSGRTTHPVGQKRANVWGLFDMHGGLWEWCWDGYDPSYYRQQPGPDPQGSAQAAQRVIRGGCWSALPPTCRSAMRGKLAPDDRNAHVGFRVVRNQSGS